MCDPFSLAVAATAAGVTSAVGNVVSGIGASRLAGQQANAQEAEGRAEINAANERANRLRLQGGKFLAQQRLDIINSGIEGGTGSALEVGGADAAEIELDALTERYGGVTRGAMLKKQAKFTREAGRGRMIGSFFRAGADVLSTAPAWPALKGP